MHDDDNPGSPRNRGAKRSDFVGWNAARVRLDAGIGVRTPGGGH
jgi:hypothetical protein